MKWRTIGVGLFFASALLFAAPPSLATDVCIVQRSADGFVALRARPSASADLVVRAKPGEAVVIQKSSGGDLMVSGAWLRVTHYPDTVVPQKTDPAFRLGKTGWMHKRFVDECG